MASDVKWIKITTDIFDDEKILLIESMPSADSVIVIWFKLLTFAGKQNNDGVFMMSNRIAYTDEMLASIFRREVNTVRMALKVFEQFGMIEIVDNVITIPNWSKHQTLDAYEKKKVRDRERMARKRAEQKALIGKSLDQSPDQSLDQSLDQSPDVASIDKEEDIDKDKEKDKKKKKKPSVYSDDPELNQALLSFIEYRKSIKKPMTDRAVELLINKLEGMTPSITEQIEILNQSIVNGWQGIFPLKEQKQSAKLTYSYQKPSKADELNDFYNMAANWAESEE